MGSTATPSRIRVLTTKLRALSSIRINGWSRHAPLAPSARTDLGGGRSVVTVPTALHFEPFRL